jgi:hypothetical protein
VASLSVRILTCVRLELAYAKKGVPYIEPRVVDLNEGSGKPDNVISFHMGSLLERILQTNTALR